MARKPKLLAYCLSDPHISLWAQFNDGFKRTKMQLDWLRELTMKKIPVLCCGDLFHVPNTIDQDLLDLWATKFVTWNHNFYCISGNHDIKRTSVIDEQDLLLPISWVNIFGGRLISLDYQSVKFDNVMVYGIPYIDHNIGLAKYVEEMELTPGFKHVLMIHSSLPGAKDTDGREIEAENLTLKDLEKFDLVLCGHIHKPQKLGKNVQILGAPFQQRRSDKGCTMGYWELYNDLSLKFIPLDFFPKFIDVHNKSEIKDDGNFYTILPKEVEPETKLNHSIKVGLTPKRMVRRYFRAKGIKDPSRRDLLINIIEKASE